MYVYLINKSDKKIKQEYENSKQILNVCIILKVNLPKLKTKFIIFTNYYSIKYNI